MGVMSLSLSAFGFSHVSQWGCSAGDRLDATGSTLSFSVNPLSMAVDSLPAAAGRCELEALGVSGGNETSIATGATTFDSSCGGCPSTVVLTVGGFGVGGGFAAVPASPMAGGFGVVGGFVFLGNGRILLLLLLLRSLSTERDCCGERLRGGSS